MMLRPGLLYSGEVLNDSPAKLMRFVFSKLDTAMIELTANQMRVWINEVLLTRPSVGPRSWTPILPAPASMPAPGRPRTRQRAQV